MASLRDYDVSKPREAVVKLSDRITPEKADEVRNILLNIQDPGFEYTPGQSIGVYIPGPHEFGNPYHLRLYSIANARTNPSGGGVDIELCVRRCFYIDEVSGEQYPGIASNRLCDAKAGEKIILTGPYGSHFRVPMDNRANLLMIGTGTGVAPFRAFIQQVYARQNDWKGRVRLFYGAKTGMEKLYRNDKNDDLANYYSEDTFKAFEGLGKRSWTSEEKVIENTLHDHAEEIWEMIQDEKTHVYLAGLEKLTESLAKAMAEVAGSESKWKWARQELIEQKRWSELLYI
jgi:ferredoxin--NADP+ reductase